MQSKSPTYSRKAVSRALEMVTDPEIPVLTIVDLGIIADIECGENWVTVSIVPTYSGCPAMDTIRDEIIFVLSAHGYHHVKVETVLSPVWTTDRMTEKGRRKLKEFGIAPPVKRLGASTALDSVSPACPQCGSDNTHLVNEFGSTSCKAMYKCGDCLEPFDYFKCV